MSYIQINKVKIPDNKILNCNTFIKAMNDFNSINDDVKTTQMLSETTNTVSVSNNITIDIP